MKVVIVEDELAASENLAFLLKNLEGSIEILAVLDSVKASIAYFSKNNEAELVFMDIHLADGLSFEIFDSIKIEAPIIFTTAYDQYSLQAFKVNSIDYLLKPIDEDELASSLEQYKGQFKGKGLYGDQVTGLLNLMNTKKTAYKSMYLVPHRDELIPLKTENMAYLYIDTGIVKAVTNDNQTYIMEQNLEDLESDLDPSEFFRLNRQFIVRRDVISGIKQYFNGKLIVNVIPPSPEKIVVSRAKSPEFKNWMNQ
ncbi:two component transcriptional regulator, LytTR family [Arenibacter nanhaiticus]|uniref:Two component transcriptional regulator, LytTR family n=1 Tax=Arenibacter nanhaiticus TaxID=558155 RepID=A0A1M6JW13_9FLAO|nr:LytTR family DNA-binding domain-containing protein [Arenibacter nanhaiticus]SHJ50887.1 two component transcriptional regulator, LytTR family [Arenibacter nanhaiticus]